MIVNLLELINNTKNKIPVESSLTFDENTLKETSIRKLKDVFFKGKIVKLIDDSFELTGVISGTMILPDDITLEDFEYQFSSEIEEKLDETRINLQKSIDITDILWQNILVEIPLKAVNPQNENLKLEGNGWRLISEEDVKLENNPLSELEDLLRKE